MSSAVKPLSISGTPAAEMRVLLSRAEILLEQLESVLSRSEEMYRRLSQTMDIPATDQVQRDLRAEIRSFRAFGLRQPEPRQADLN